MDPDMNATHHVAAFQKWQHEHGEEAHEAEMEFIEATDTSLNFRGNDMLLQLIFPIDASQGETFIAMTLDGAAPDSLMMALNEKLERVRGGLSALSKALDIICKSLICFRGKRGGSKRNDADSIGPADRQVDDDGGDSDAGGKESDSEGEGENHGDFEEENIHLCVREFEDQFQRGTQPGEASHHTGYLHRVSQEAGEKCEEVRQLSSMDENLTHHATPSFSGSLGHSYMQDILKYFHVSTVHTMAWVRLRVEVAGVVNDVRLATALGLAFCNTMNIFLEFDKLFWCDSSPRRPLGVSRVIVRMTNGMEPSGPYKNFTRTDASLEFPGNDSDVEYQTELRKYPGRLNGAAYGADTLLPELINAFFKYRGEHNLENLRSKRWRNTCLDEALVYFAEIQNPLVGLMCFIGTQLRALPGWCPVCWSQLPASVWRLRTCQTELCLYEFEELGLGSTIYQEIQESPELVELELSLACAAATQRRDVFEPYPSFLLHKGIMRGRSGWFSKPGGEVAGEDDADNGSFASTAVTTAVVARSLNPVVTPQGALGNVDVSSSRGDIGHKKLSFLLETLQSIPSMDDFKDCTDENSLKRRLSKAAFSFEKTRTDRDSFPKGRIWLSYNLMRFILSTNRLSLRLLSEKDNLNMGIACKHQFVVLHDTPEKEAIFEERRAQRGSFFAFHGSRVANWYSILRNGLRSMSRTKYMSAGASYGDGIYLADNFNLSYSYAKVPESASTWNNGSLKEGMTVMAICEVVTGSADGSSGSSRLHSFTRPNGIFVVSPGREDDVAVRYLLVMDGVGARPISGSYTSVSGTLASNNYNHHGYSGVKISGSKLEDSHAEGRQQQSVDLQAHYRALRDADRDLQDQMLLFGRAEALARVRKGVAALNKRSDAGVDMIQTPVICDSNCASSVKVRERASQSVATVAENSAGGAVAVVRSSKRLKVVPVPRSGSASVKSSLTATPIATQAISKEFRNVQAEINKANKGGDSFLTYVTVEIPDETDIYQWHVCLQQDLFKSSPKLYKDLQHVHGLQPGDKSHILLEVSFNGQYPFQPPFIRVVRPKFSFHTGHVTIGGSICMELLTDSGWLPSFSFESVLVQIVNAIIEGGGRIDTNARGQEYSKHEAMEAFARVASLHGWEFKR